MDECITMSGIDSSKKDYVVAEANWDSHSYHHSIAHLSSAQIQLFIYDNYYLTAQILQHDEWVVYAIHA